MTSPDPSPRRLTRATGDRMVGGVAAGVARHFDLDPALVRIAFVILAFFGGAGLALYAAAAVLLPVDDGTPAYLSSTSSTGKVVAGVLVLVLIVSVPFGEPWFLIWPGLVGLTLLAAAGVLVWRAVGGGNPALARAALVILGVGAAAVLGVGAGLAAAFGGGVVVAAVVIAAGVALIAGAFLGGARWLIVPALLLALPVSVVAAADLELEGGVGEREYRPSSVLELRDEYRVGVGRLHVDMREVAFSGRTELRARAGLGQIELTVPEDVCVQTVAEVGAGQIDLLDRSGDGIDVEVEDRRLPAFGAPLLVVDADVGMGHIAINRRPLLGDHHPDDPPVEQAACAP